MWIEQDGKSFHAGREFTDVGKCESCGGVLMRYVDTQEVVCNSCGIKPNSFKITDWFDVTTLSMTYHVQVSKDGRYRHRAPGSNTWFDGMPEKTCKP